MASLLRRIKFFLKVALRKGFFVKTDVRLPMVRFGSDYGGWNILTEGIDSYTVVYSFGVGEDASFDRALIKKFALTVHAFDPTPKSIAWVKNQNFSERFLLHEYGIAAFDGLASFCPPENPDHVSHTLLNRPPTQEQSISVPVKRLSTIMNDLGHTKIDILKMDIEGAEYDVISDISRSHIRPQQILVEFHHRFPGVGIRRTKAAIKCIRDMGYSLFSVSESNEEFCFCRTPPA